MLLFQECDFAIIGKPGKLNGTPNHLSRIEMGEEPTNLEEGLHDAQLFSIKVVDAHFADIIQFLTTSMELAEYSVQQNKELVTRVANFTIITG